MSGIEHLYLRCMVEDLIYECTKLRVLREGGKAVVLHDLLHNLFVLRIENSSRGKGCYLF
jgi:stalled ribosome alternative rescue factor ArfA